MFVLPLTQENLTLMSDAYATHRGRRIDQINFTQFYSAFIPSTLCQIIIKKNSTQANRQKDAHNPALLLYLNLIRRR
jgi:hypothetical protein